MRIGVIGGTGREGRGLALRWAKAGHHVSIGSRDAERAKERADELAALIGGDAKSSGRIGGGDNAWCVSEAEVVLLSVPYGAHAETLRALAPVLEGRILIDITVPLHPPKVDRVHLPAGQSAAMEAQAILGPNVKVVAALHHVSSTHLSDPDHAIECDVLVCGNDAAARDTVISLIGDLGTRGLDAGVLQNAVALESLTPVLIHMNKRYKSAGTGIRIVGL